MYSELGQTYLAAGQPSAAIDAARRGAAIDPNSSSIKNLMTLISRAQGTPAAPVVASASPTPPVPPGMYVSDVSINPPELKNGQMPTFIVTFLNTLGVNADYTWYVKLYEADKKNSFGETAKASSSIPAGNNPFSTFSNWKAPGATSCQPFIARVFYATKDNAVIEFPKPGAIASGTILPSANEE